MWRFVGVYVVCYADDVLDRGPRYVGRIVAIRRYVCIRHGVFGVALAGEALHSAAEAVQGCSVFRCVSLDRLSLSTSHGFVVPWLGLPVVNGAEEVVP